MAERKWKPPISQEKRKQQDSKKGETYKSPDNKYSYLKRGVVKVYLPKAGDNKIRIVQPLEVDELGFYGLEVHFHRNIGPEQGDYLCNSRMKSILMRGYADLSLSSECPECEKQTSDLWDNKPEIAKTYYPTRRMWLWVLDLLSEEPDEVKIWSAPWTLHEEILAHSHKKETEVYIPIDCPFEGPPITFTRTGKGLKDTKYTNVQVFEKAYPLNDGHLEQMVEFRDCLNIPTYEEFVAGDKGLDYTPSQEESTQRQEEDLPASVEDGEFPSQESDPEDVFPPECFQKEFDKYQDCDTCEAREECKPKPKVKKQEKPQRVPRKIKNDSNSKTEKAASTETKQDTEDAGEEDAAAVRKRKVREQIAKAREKRAKDEK